MWRPYVRAAKCSSLKNRQRCPQRGNTIKFDRDSLPFAGRAWLTARRGGINYIGKQHVKKMGQNQVSRLELQEASRTVGAAQKIRSIREGKS
jgi:hypothetical protein